MMELSIEPWLCASEPRPEASKTGKKAKKSVQKQVDFCEKSGKIGGAPGQTDGQTDGLTETSRGQASRAPRRKFRELSVSDEGGR